MKTIELTQGKVALVDDVDFEPLAAFPWFALFSIENKNWYAARNSAYRLGRRTQIRMHRVILGASPKEEIDHKNGNGLDNQRTNLRRVTHQHNAWNMQRRINPRGKLKGIAMSADGVRWRARIRVSGQEKFLGHFTSPTEAALTYDAAARQYFGEYACVNFPREGEQSCRYSV